MLVKQSTSGLRTDISDLTQKYLSYPAHHSRGTQSIEDMSTSNFITPSATHSNQA